VFDVGFTELMLIGVIGLLILGPERLPGAVRTGSLWLGRLRKQFSEIKAEVEREIGADEIRNQIHNESIMRDLQKTRDALDSTAKAMRDPIKAAMEHAADSINSDETNKPAPSSSALDSTTTTDTNPNSDSRTQ